MTTDMTAGLSFAFAPGYAPGVALHPNTLLAPSDVARAWGMSSANVTLMIREGRLPAERDEETGRYGIRAAELDRRPIVTEIDGPASQLRKASKEQVAELRRRSKILGAAESKRLAAEQERNAYIVELYEAGVDPIDIGRQLPGEFGAEHMHRSTVHRIIREYRRE